MLLRDDYASTAPFGSSTPWRPLDLRPLLPDGGRPDMRTIWLHARLSGLRDHHVPPHPRSRALAVAGTWVVPPETRPTGWESLGLKEPAAVPLRTASVNASHNDDPERGACLGRAS